MQILCRFRCAKLASLIAVVCMASSLVNGCSGGSDNINPEAAGLSGPEAPPFSLPQIPTGENDVRQGTVVDSDTVQGSAFFDSFGATIDGTAVTIEAGTTPVDIMAYGIYQHVARPDPAVPYMVSVLGYYQDVDPVDIDPSEGYYFLYADYNLHRWVIGGLYKTTNTRIQLPETADVVSNSGFIYTAVVAYNGNAVNVTNVQVGYDDGPGYEQYVLPEVPGLSVGAACDIELDDAGVPQIAYFVSSKLIEASDFQIRVARLVGDEWEHQAITSVADPKSFDFALGSAGRRALIIFNDAGHQYLLLDTGSGEFTVEFTSEGGVDIPNDPITSVHPAITYINGVDDPLGELDTVLSLYAIPNLLDPTKIDTHSIRADGSAPLVDVIIGSGETLEVSDLGLTTFSDKMARTTIPISGLVESNCVFGSYSAVVDGWGPAVIANWEELYLDLGSDRYEGVMLRELPGGNVVAGYRHADDPVYVFGVWDGLVWTSLPSDKVYCLLSPSEMAVDFEPSSPGTISFPTLYGNFSPVLYSGNIGNASPFDTFYINSEPFSCSDISLAVNGPDVLHMAWQRPMDGQLVYNTLELGEMTGEQVVDYGADGNAKGFGPAPLVADGDTLHIFHLDYAHGQIVYSRNVAGIWEAEQQPVLPVSQTPYILVQAGLLENTGEIYVGYLDFLDFTWRVLISDANQETWRVVDINQFLLEYMYITDDESSIAALYYIEDMDTGNIELFFDTGIGGPGGATTELAVTMEDWTNPPTTMAYNRFNDTWYIATNDRDNQTAYLFRRAAPGTWQGPYTIDQQTTGIDGRLSVFGLACRHSDGQINVFIDEKDHGTTINRFSSMTSDPELIAFGSKVEIASVDSPTVFETDWEVFPATDAQGELALKLTRHLVADPLQDVLMFTEDSGVWSFELWDTPVEEHLAWLTPGFAVMGNGLPAATLVEYNNARPLVGRVFVYYPW